MRGAFAMGERAAILFVAIVTLILHFGLMSMSTVDAGGILPALNYLLRLTTTAWL